MVLADFVYTLHRCRSFVHQHLRKPPPPENALLKQARPIHEKVITLDTHIHFDTYAQRLDIEFNLPKMSY
jgi:hypothetical protein